VTRQIVLTRLPVGHTHEDIDGRFGTLWNHFKNKPIWTPKAYAKRCSLSYTLDIFVFLLLFIIINIGISAFRDGAETVKVIDVDVIPDYTAYLTGSIDPYLSK